MEGAVERDDAPALGIAAHELVAPRRLDGGFAGFSARIAEEDAVGERLRDEPLGELLLSRDPVEIGRVPELFGLLGERADKAGMGVAEHVHGYARRRNRGSARPRE